MGAHPAIEAFYRACNAHDTAAVEALYATGALQHEVAQGQTVEGAAAIRGGLERFLQAFPDARWDPEPAILQDGRAAVPYRLTGTLHGALGPFQAEGQKLDLLGVHVLELDRKGRIRRSSDYWDAATFARQMRR
ncbi:MAG: ester cyclase [Solirubrobacteraceae bacterium]